MSLLARSVPQTSDIVVTSTGPSFGLHKFVLAARSPYFRKKLSAAPETRAWRLPASVPPPAFAVAIRYLYLGELPQDVGGGPGTGCSEEQVLEGIDRVSAQLEIRSLWHGILENHDRRLARQYQADEAERGRGQIEAWFRDHVLKYAIRVEAAQADGVRWDSANGIFADVLLRADDDNDEPSDASGDASGAQTPHGNGGSSIPVGPLLATATARADARPPRMATLFPAHKAMLLRSEFFAAMFSSAFAEAQESPHLRIIPVDCSPEVLQLVLTFLYTDRADLPLHAALDVLFAADMLLIERLKNKAAVIISTLGSGPAPSREPASGKPHGDATADGPPEEDDDDPLDPFAVLRAAWLLRVPRLEEFAARYLAYRLERYVDRPDFRALVAESAARIRARQATDSIELVDDIRHYLSERFRMRFEDAGIHEMITGEEGVAQEAGMEPAEKVDGNEDGAAEAPREDEDRAPAEALAAGGDFRTLDGEPVEDEFESDALNYRVLLEKIDVLLEGLDLDG